MEQSELYEVKYRVGALESQAKEFQRLFQEIQKENVRNEEALKGVREQAKAHNESHLKSFAEMRQQMADDRLSIENMISGSVRELQGGLDKLINALGIDEDIHAASHLRSNLQALSDMITSRKDDIMWIKRGIITLVVSAVGGVLVLGIKAFFGSVGIIGGE